MPCLCRHDEVAQTIKDDFAFVGFNSLQDVGMVSQDQIGSRIDRRMCDFPFDTSRSEPGRSELPNAWK